MGEIMSEILKIQIPKIIDQYPSVNLLKSFASLYNKDQWEKLCLNKEFLNLIMEEKNIEKTQILANSILGIIEEKPKKEGGDDNRELVNAS